MSHVRSDWKDGVAQHGTDELVRAASPQREKGRKGMDVIVHRIRLHEGVDLAAFERWVRETDYATCPLLPSVLSFEVQRASREPDADCHYFEVIGVRSREEFGRDVESAAFRSLVADFEKMATVLDELVGERLEPGYLAA